MADNELTLKLKLEDQQFKAAMKEVVSFGKLIETEYKRGKISATEAGNAINKLMAGIDGLGKVAKPSTDALASLWHQQNRIGLGFKSLATETMGARNQFKEMLSEQRLGNRLMSETVGSIKTLSNAFGMGGLGAAASKMADSFQGVEFAVNGMSTAMTSAGGKIGKFGAFLGQVAMPLTLLGSGIAYAISSFNELAAAATAAGKATAQAFMTGAEKRLQAGDPATWMRTLESRRTEAARKATGLEGEYMRVQGYASSPFLGSAEGKLAAYQAQIAYKAWQEALKERVRLDDLIWEAQQKEKKNADAAPTFAPNVYTGEIIPAPYGRSPAYGVGGVGLGTGLGMSGVNIPGQLAGVSPKPESWGTSRAPMISWDEISDESKTFFSGMSSMTATLSAEVLQGLGGAFVTVFGEANSLMEKLLQSFIMGIADALLKLGMKKAVSFIPVVGPLIAEMINTTPTSSRSFAPENEIAYTSHSSGGSQIGELSSRVGALSDALARGSWRARGTDLVFVTERARSIYERGTM